jgi:hypothetical protein
MYLLRTAFPEAVGKNPIGRETRFTKPLTNVNVKLVSCEYTPVEVKEQGVTRLGVIVKEDLYSYYRTYDRVTVVR